MNARIGVDAEVVDDPAALAVSLVAAVDAALRGHDASIVAARPSSNRMSITIALSSPVVLSAWTERVAPGERIADDRVLAEE